MPPPPLISGRAPLLAAHAWWLGGENCNIFKLQFSPPSHQAWVVSDRTPPPISSVGGCGEVRGNSRIKETTVPRTSGMNSGDPCL